MKKSLIGVSLLCCLLVSDITVATPVLAGDTIVQQIAQRDNIRGVRPVKAVRRNIHVNRTNININNRRVIVNRRVRVVNPRVIVNRRVRVVNPRVTLNRRVIVNRVPWWWNRGRSWHPRSGYWGGGFWGAFTLGALTGGIIGTTAVNRGDTYVIVEKGSPGDVLLENYGLRQARCRNDGSLVVIQGPQGSIICAYPTNDFPPGGYRVDPRTLTLSSRF